MNHIVFMAAKVQRKLKNSKFFTFHFSLFTFFRIFAANNQPFLNQKEL